MKLTANYKNLINRHTLCCLFICLYNFSSAQKAPNISCKSITTIPAFNGSNSFIENIGQYGTSMSGYENMGNIQFGYEGLDMPVLFTPKGLIHLQRKIEKISHAEEEKLEKQGLPEAEIERRRKITDRVISTEWIGANPTAEIIKENKTTDYHTYGMLTAKAFGYKKLTYSPYAL